MKFFGKVDLRPTPLRFADDMDPRKGCFELCEIALFSGT